MQKTALTAVSSTVTPIYQILHRHEPASPNFLFLYPVSKLSPRRLHKGNDIPSTPRLRSLAPRKGVTTPLYSLCTRSSPCQRQNEIFRVLLGTRALLVLFLKSFEIPPHGSNLMSPVIGELGIHN